MSEPWLTRTRACWRRALAVGDLEPLAASDPVVLVDRGVEFRVRVLTGAPRKPLGTRETDPFVPPYVDALFVGDASPTHAVLLNKFPVLEDHLLVVPRNWADQESPPDRQDWDALAVLLGEIDGLGLYNGGRAAGASQPHRHLQLVPRAAFGPIGTEPAVLAALAGGRTEVPGWPIRHAITALPDTRDLGAALADAAHRLLARFDPGPFDLLWTRGWMLGAPRRAGAHDGVPVNALGYAGSLVVRDPAALHRLRQRGPFALLAEVGFSAAR